MFHLHPPGEYISDHIRRYDSWEPITSEILIELINKSDKKNTIFVDIGANIGYFSILMALQNITVIAIEPETSNYNLLTKNITHNNLQHLITPHKTFISNSNNTTFTLNIDPTNMGSVSNRFFTQNNPNIPLKSQSTTSKTIDSFLGLNPSNNIIVKIDVEEHELEVLQGMEQTLKLEKITYIIIELGPVYKKQIFDIFRKYNFNNIVLLGDCKPRSIKHNTNYLSLHKHKISLNQFELYKQNTTQQHLILIHK